MELSIFNTEVSVFGAEVSVWCEVVRIEYRVVPIQFGGVRNSIWKCPYSVEFGIQFQFVCEVNLEMSELDEKCSLSEKSDG